MNYIKGNEKCYLKRKSKLLEECQYEKRVKYPTKKLPKPVDTGP